MLDLSVGGAPTAPATLAVEIVCVKAAWSSVGGFEARLAAAVAGLPGVRISWAPPAVARVVLPPGVLGAAPVALVIKVGGRVMAHALGELPRWELRSLIETALRNAR